MTGIKISLINIAATIVVSAVFTILYSEDYPTLKDKAVFVLAMVVIDIGVESVYAFWKKYKKR